jgi:hypothetical protein
VILDGTDCAPHETNGRLVPARLHLETAGANVGDDANYRAVRIHHNMPRSNSVHPSIVRPSRKRNAIGTVARHGEKQLFCRKYSRGCLAQDGSS